jgi:transcriptional regulator with XRE-family HTH domain
MDMTAVEFAAARQRLGWSVEQTAAVCGVTPHVVSAWDRGTVRIPGRTAQLLRWHAAVAERDAVLAASGLSVCSTRDALEQAMTEKDGDEREEAVEALVAHDRACPLCKEQEDYLNRHGPPLPESPQPLEVRVFVLIGAAFARLPAPFRPPPGIAGKGREMGLWFGVAFSMLAVVIVVVMLVGAGRDPDRWREAGTLLVVVIPAYVIGFYCAGATYDALRPIGHTLLGYVLRWGLGAAIVYGTIGLGMPLISDDHFSAKGTVGFALGMGVVWGLFVGGGLWVKDLVTGKLPRPPA